MNYRTFDNYQKGFSHEKNGTPCEDYAASYADADGQFFISVICDGHSDKNCFRSAKGAQFGCQAAIEVLSRFFSLYREEPVPVTPEAETRLKKSIRQRWDQLVRQDLSESPPTKEETQLLSDRVKAMYDAGQGLPNIYGATFAAVAASQDLFLVLHIGDGVVMCVDADGTYYEPLPHDEKSDMGSPASLCDSDLFTREAAFRSAVLEQIPLAAVVSSDGIEDCMDRLQFMEFVCSLLQKMQAMEQGDGELNDAQKQCLAGCVSFYTKKGNGAEDDCSLAGLYALEQEVPPVKIPAGLARQLCADTVQEMNGVVRDYERRKRETLENIKRLESSLPDPMNDPDRWITAKTKIENLKQILNNIVKNEQEKLSYYSSRIQMCREYIKRAEGSVSGIPGAAEPRIAQIDPRALEEDTQFLQIQALYDEYQSKRSKSIQLKRSRDDTKGRYEAARREARRRAPEDQTTLPRLKAKESELSAKYEVARQEAAAAEADWWEGLKQASRTQKKSAITKYSFPEL